MTGRRAGRPDISNPFNGSWHHSAMSGPGLHYVSSGRRAITIVALLACACFLAFAITGGAPWWFYPPVVFATIGAAYMVALNPQSGLTLDERRLTVFSGSWRRSVDLVDLAGLRIVEWVDGPPSAEVNLMDGSSFAIPSVCLPKKAALVEAAKQYGIPLA